MPEDNKQVPIPRRGTKAREKVFICIGFVAAIGVFAWNMHLNHSTEKHISVETTPITREQYIETAHTQVSAQISPDSNNSPVASCRWADLKDVVVSMESVNAEALCRTMQITLNRFPPIALARKLSKLIFVIQVDTEGKGPSPKELSYQIMNVVEARNVTDNDAAIDETFDTLAKVYSGTQGRITPRDINIELRHAGVIATTINQDGIFGLAAVMLQAKKARGE